MPYKNISELESSLKKILPIHARHIYKEAFNNAYEQYKDPSKRQGAEGREEVAHKVAWSAVKNLYAKGDDDKWHRKTKEDT